VLITPPRSPQANAFAERAIGTLRRDCLDHIIVWGERHAARILNKYVATESDPAESGGLAATRAHLF